MSTVAEIQAAVERLPATDRIALFHWLEETDVVRGEERRALLDELDAGLTEADRSELLEGNTVIESLRARARGAA
jgi:predicted 2-oxoglutarate/Fe(II)-dependent dioxygenase YbiX